MLEPLFFALGVVNSVLLTLIFIFRGKRLELVQRFGWLYFLLAFLAIEALYDWILRIPFVSTRTGGSSCLTWPCTSPPTTASS